MPLLRNHFINGVKKVGFCCFFCIFCWSWWCFCFSCVKLRWYECFVIVLLFGDQTVGKHV